MKVYVFFLAASIACLACSNDPDGGDAADAAPQTMNNTPDMTVVADATIPAIPDANMVSDAMAPQSPDQGLPMDTQACTGLCEYLELCGSCFYDDQGECLDIPGCVEVCQAETQPAVAECVSGLTECDGSAFQGCYDASAGDDDCANTCRFLEECNECFTDENGDCLSIAACALICRDMTPPMAAACIARLNDCSGIQGCFQSTP